MQSHFEYFNNIAIEALIDYFNQPQEESNQIEFKSGETDVSKLYKEICAFANTDGGVLIWGAPKEINFKSGEKSTANRVCQGKLTPTEINKTEDSLIQTLMANISPAPIGIIVRKFSYEQGYAYIIIVPKSLYPPHQVGGTYYIRVNTMSVPAPHGIVQAFFNQKKPIDLVAKIKIEKELVEHNKEVGITIAVTNKSKYPAVEIEGFVSIVGKLYEVKETPVLNMVSLKEGRVSLSTGLKFKSASILGLWVWHSIYGIRILGEYCYVELFIWAKETHGFTKLFKLYNNGTIHEIDLDSADDLEKEYEEWMSLDEEA